MGRLDETTIIKLGVNQSGQDSGDWDYRISNYMYFDATNEQRIEAIKIAEDLIKELKRLNVNNSH